MAPNERPRAYSGRAQSLFFAHGWEQNRDHRRCPKTGGHSKGGFYHHFNRQGKICLTVSCSNCHREAFENRRSRAGRSKRGALEQVPTRF